MDRPPSRRDLLRYFTALFGGLGLGGAVYPFIRALEPPRDILRAGVMEVDIKDLKEGEVKTVLWRGQPVFILRRTEEMIEKTMRIDPSTLKDPATPAERALRQDIFVSIGICTHLGCIPRFKPEGVEGTDQPGFYCPCHGGKYDSLGRRLDGPPPENLHLLPYRFVDTWRLIIGEETFGGYNENIRVITRLPGMKG